MHCWLFAWHIIRQWLIVTLNIHSSSQSSSVYQLAWLIIRVIGYSTMIRQWLFNQPARVMDYSTMIESHWLVVINPPTHQNWLFVRVVNRAQATNPHDWSFGWLIMQQRFDNDGLINQLAWLINWQWLSHIGYSGLINHLIKLIIHSSSQSSSINQPARLIFRVIDFLTMIQQSIVDYSCEWLFSNGSTMIV